MPAERAPLGGGFQVLKQDLEEGYVLGEVLVPEEVDLQGDIYDAGVVLKAAHYFLKHMRNVGYMHDVLVNDRVAVVESGVNHGPDYEVALPDGTRHTVKHGAWLLAVQSDDPEVKKLIGQGLLNGFSVAGPAQSAAAPPGRAGKEAPPEAGAAAEGHDG